jgi:hypothetical protein
MHPDGDSSGFSLWQQPGRSVAEGVSAQEQGVRRGEEIVLREKGKGLARAFEILANLPDDFLPEGRHDTPPQEREGI